MIDFTDIGYLRHGNARQREAYALLTDCAVMVTLKRFDPILVGSIPLNVGIETSDADIICCWQAKDEFVDAVTKAFGTADHFGITEKETDEGCIVRCQLAIHDFDIEIFGCSIPSMQQNAYKHMLARLEVVKRYGESFRKEVVNLKRKGIKTSEAIKLLLDDLQNGNVGTKY
jgi:hypothetical protein